MKSAPASKRWLAAWNKGGVGTWASGGVALPRYRVPGRDEPLTVETAENGGAPRQIRRPQQRFLALICKVRYIYLDFKKLIYIYYNQYRFADDSIFDLIESILLFLYLFKNLIVFYKFYKRYY